MAAAALAKPRGTQEKKPPKIGYVPFILAGGRASTKLVKKRESAALALVQNSEKGGSSVLCTVQSKREGKGKKADSSVAHLKCSKVTPAVYPRSP